jgi:hypothetical protein
VRPCPSEPSLRHGRPILSLFAIALFATTTFTASVARAAEPPSENVQRARAEFVGATEHVKNARWGEALAAFERSLDLRPHALTIFNIGACERALGRYLRARASLQRAVEVNDTASPRELAPSFVSDAKKWIQEIDGIVVRASVSIHPADAALLVDGAPIAQGLTDREYVALPYVRASSTAPRPLATPTGPFTLALDPGVHVFSLSRAGFANVVLSKTLAPGTTPEIALDMQSLPASIHIASNRVASVVTLDELDVGIAPVQLTRPAGSYRVAVRKVGYVPYEARVKVGPGEAPSIQATLAEEKPPITKKVWFWAAAAAVVAGAAVGTYFLARPDPERPAPNGGGLGWVVTLPGAAR